MSSRRVAQFIRFPRADDRIRDPAATRGSYFQYSLGNSKQVLDLSASVMIQMRSSPAA